MRLVWNIHFKTRMREGYPQQVKGQRILDLPVNSAKNLSWSGLRVNPFFGCNEFAESSEFKNALDI